MGTKRICVDTGYYQTYNRDNVTLIDISNDPIGAITPTGLSTSAGDEYEFDSIIYATGLRCNDRRAAPGRHSGSGRQDLG